MESVPGADDESLRLAKLLHMELNGRGSRRVRQPAPIPAALVKAARKIKQREPSTSAESGEVEDAGQAAEAVRKKRRKKGEASGSEANDSDPQSSKQPVAEAAPGGVRRRKGAGGRGRVPAPGRRHLLAAAEARRKAAAAGGKARPGSTGAGAGQQERQAQRTHVKCFFVGLRWGALLPVAALRSREKLAEAVATAFGDDGASVAAGTAHVVFVGANAATSEFVGGGGGEEDGGWAAAAKKAVRIYVR